LIPTLRKSGEGYGTHVLMSYRKSGKGWPTRLNHGLSLSS
jgi:hypothetical protein